MECSARAPGIVILDGFPCVPYTPLPSLVSLPEIQVHCVLLTLYNHKSFNRPTHREFDESKKTSTYRRSLPGHIHIRRIQRCSSGWDERLKNDVHDFQGNCWWRRPLWFHKLRRRPTCYFRTTKSIDLRPERLVPLWVSADELTPQLVSQRWTRLDPWS